MTVLIIPLTIILAGVALRLLQHYLGLDILECELKDEFEGDER